MSFWRKSEDPWDQKPRKPEESSGPKGELLDSLRTWNEDRKTKAKEKEDAKRLPPQPCPWCKQEMEQGFLTGGRDAVQWHPGVHKFDFFRGLNGDAFSILDEGGAFTGCYKTAWLCRECGKLVLSIPEPERVYDFPESQYAGTEETKKEETSEE